MPSIRLRAGGLVLAAGLAVAGVLAAPALADSSSASSSSGKAHGKGGKGKKAAAPQIPREGFWKLASGASQEIFVNQGKAAVQVTTYVCVDPKPGGHPVVRVEMLGRAPVEAPVGCQSVYLLVDTGDWVALVNPGTDNVSGSYKVADGG